ncbi:hypothetical protein HYX09_04410 [Candidatus Woesearchaeota archaeon]|nr:hypothetical protein [Candidatus Woesearchaeota archaeon]
MDEMLVRKIKENLMKEGGSVAAFHSPEYRPIRIDKENYHEIRIEDPADNKIAFVDGGSCILINSSDFVLGLIRACCITFLSNKRISVKRKECYAATSAVGKDGKIFYLSEIFQSSQKLFEKGIFEFSSMDRNLMAGSHRADIAKITDVMRRLAELNMAEEVVKNLDKDDILIMDGLLECDLQEEREAMQRIYDEGADRNVIISSISKTDTIFSDDGGSLPSVLAKNAPFGTWYYHPVAEILSEAHQAGIFLAKLHAHSKHIFRIEMYKGQHPDLDMFFRLLANNSKDPVFLGYPYGMIEADRLARVGGNEAGMLKNSVAARLGRMDLASLTSSRNAHEILDKVNY